MQDIHDLKRFVAAQQPVYEQVCAELCQGWKRTHWMWFVFPQIKGLGHSSMAQRYAIASRAEAEAYLRHPLLGARLYECTRLVNAVEERSVAQIFGDPDDLKFHSSMTLFAQASENSDAFDEALRKYFAGQPDRLTIARLREL
jgi:uncharacterized protein (DUF1810 family)